MDTECQVPSRIKSTETEQSVAVVVLQPVPRHDLKSQIAEFRLELRDVESASSQLGIAAVLQEGN